MKSSLAPRANCGENGDAIVTTIAYPHLTVRPMRLSPAGKPRDEIVAVGCQSFVVVRNSGFPGFIPSLPGVYS